MEQLNKSTLSLILGGNNVPGKVPAAVLASMTQVSSRVSDTLRIMNTHDDAAPYCNQYLHVAIAPKNGDRNALGQQYSWGTWWDDTH